MRSLRLLRTILCPIRFGGNSQQLSKSAVRARRRPREVRPRAIGNQHVSAREAAFRPGPRLG